MCCFLKGLLIFTFLFTFPEMLYCSTEIEKEIDEITDKIWESAGTLFPKPEIVFNNIEMNLDSIKTLIYYNPTDNHIYISNGFAKMCLSISKEALAVALGHEIGHYFNLHKNTVNISGYYLTDEETINLNELSSAQKTNYIELETQADLFAAFHCYCCNFDISNDWNKLIDTMYSSTKDTLIRLQLDERKRIAKFVLNKIKDLEPVYKAAKFCYLSAEYEMAAICYEYLISNSINSVEIYFNLANSYALAAINTDENAKQYIYPFEMRFFYIYDSNYVKTVSASSSRGLSKKRVDLEDYKAMMISKALLNYNYLLSHKQCQSPELFLALCALYNFAGETKTARTYLIKAEETSITDFQKNLVQLTKGLLYKNIAKDMAEFELLKAENFLPAIHNLNLIRNVKIVFKKESEPNIRKNENIAGFDLLNLRLKMQDIAETVYDSKGISFGLKKIQNLDFLALIITNNYGNGIFIETTQDYSAKSIKKITKGSSVNILKNQYGMPDNVCFFANSTYYIYNNSKIAFEIVNEKVSSWFLFLID